MEKGSPRDAEVIQAVPPCYRDPKSFGNCHCEALRSNPDEMASSKTPRHDTPVLESLYALYSADAGYIPTGVQLLQQGKPRDAATPVVAAQDADDAAKKEFLRCAACLAPIARPSDRIAVNEQHQHVFTNPHGYIFCIGCFAQAPGCLAIGEETSYFSWFPGYAWQIALCGQCLTLLGWAFRSADSQFFGLILDKLR